VLDHASNAERFCAAHGGVSGLTAMLKKPLDKEGKGEDQQVGEPAPHKQFSHPF
jgi:hypothetical protein